MQIGERLIDDDGSKFVVQRTFDPNPALKEIAAIRATGVDSFGESKHVGRVPGWLVEQWMKEAGVKWDDRKAMQDVIRRKLLSNEFNAFRNWQGTY